VKAQLRYSTTIIGVLFAAFGFASYFLYGPGAPSVAGSLPTGVEMKLTGTVVRPPEEREGYTLVFLRPERDREYPAFTRDGLVRFKILATGAGVHYGDRLTCMTKLRRPEGYRNPGVFDWGEYARLNGEDATASVKPDAVFRTGRSGSAALMRLYDIRQELARLAAKSLPPEEAALYRAMILGDQGEVGQSVRDDFAASGTTHILSVSGSHIALLASLIFLLTRLAFGMLPNGMALRLTLRVDWRKFAAWLALPAAVFYCLLAGSEVATVRALIMLAVFIAAALIDREPDILNTLSASALIALLFDPSALFDISFQLSYGCVLALALADRAWPRVPGAEGDDAAARVRKSARAFYVSAAALICTAPLVAGQFNTFSWVSVPANIVIVPFAGWVLVPLGLVSAVMHILSPSGGLPLAGLNDVILTLFMYAVRAFSAFPSANLHPPAPGNFATLLFYAALLAIIIWKAGPRMKLAGSVAAVAAFSAFCLMPLQRNEGLRVTFFDVGQGDSALVRFPDGRNMLIDGGGVTRGADPGRAAVAPYLWNHGVRKLDYIIVSHPHPDHVSGLYYIVENFKVGQIWDGGTDSLAPEGAYAGLLRIAGAKGIPHYTITSPGEVEIGGARVQILGASHAQAKEAFATENNASLVLRISFGKASFLFPGDIQSEAEEVFAASTLPLASTVMKVPHHGGRSSLCEPFLRRVIPKAAVVSTGVVSRYISPSPEVVDEFKSLGSRLFVTAEDGAVTFGTDGKYLKAWTYEASRPKRARSLADELVNFRLLLGMPAFEQKL
jgi:competence protein ComEC